MIWRISRGRVRVDGGIFFREILYDVGAWSDVGVGDGEMYLERVNRICWWVVCGRGKGFDKDDFYIFCYEDLGG